MADWYYAKAGKQHGPISAAQLKQMAQAGELTPDDLVFQEGGTQWVPSSTVKGLYGSPSSPPGRAAAPPPREAIADAPSPAAPAPAQMARPVAEPSERANYWRDVVFFRRLIAPTMIQILFWIGVASVLLSGVVTGIMGLVAMFGVGFLQGAAMVLLGLVQIPVGVLIVRLYCEVMILFFRMNETLTDVKETLQRQEKKD